MGSFYATTGITIEEELQDGKYELSWIQAQRVGKLFTKLLIGAIERAKQEQKLEDQKGQRAWGDFHIGKYTVHSHFINGYFYQGLGTRDDCKECREE